MKILILVLLMNLQYFVTKIKCVQPQDVTFIVKEQGNVWQPICIAEGNALDSGIGWIYTLPDNKDELPEIVTNFIPTQANNFSCNFAKGKYCNQQWEMEGWVLQTFATDTFEPILDSRWEEFSVFLTSPNVKEFEEKTHIPPEFNLGLSLLIPRNAEIFLCEGWNPRSNPCYYINIGGTDNRKVLLKKITALPELLSNITNLANYKSDATILSDDEWKSFQLTFTNDGILKLKELSKNVTFFSYKDANPFKPTYFIARSENTTGLWKVHHNQYIYTNVSKVTQFGPTLQVNSSEVCISFYMHMCEFCSAIIFTSSNGSRKISQEVKKDQMESKWQQVKIITNNIAEREIEIYIETKVALSMENGSGFWLVDDVRICNKEEIKVTKLLSNALYPQNDLKISCQSVKYPTWRPTPQYFTEFPELLMMESLSTSTSLTFSWKPDTFVLSYHRYIIHYEGKDLCTAGTAYRSTQREKSNGFVVVTTFDKTIKNLVPYTLYNINIWNAFDNKVKSYDFYTLPTDKPTVEEIPFNVNVDVDTGNSNVIFWEEPTCNSTYGPLVYEVNVTSLEGNFSKIFQDVRTEYAVEKLPAFINFSVIIHTARKMENFQNENLAVTTSYNFTTFPSVAPQVDNLEAYSTGITFASLRYDLPRDLGGIPEYVNIEYCHPLYEHCQTIITELKRCQIWKNKYCNDIDNLISNYDYSFSVSIKNEDTYAFGESSIVTTKTEERVPGKPLNIMSDATDCQKTIGYCNVNISWFHPYEQNGTITHFDIVLKETVVTNNSEIAKGIKEVLRISNNNYSSQYSYVVKYVPYGTFYNVSVQSSNDKYSGEFATIHMIAKDFKSDVEQVYQLLQTTESTLVYSLPENYGFLTTFVVIVQDYDTTKSIGKEIAGMSYFQGNHRLCKDFGNTWIAYEVTMQKNYSRNVTIGDKSSLLNGTILNRPLEPGTKYCINFVRAINFGSAEKISVSCQCNVFTKRNIFLREKLTYYVIFAVFPLFFLIILPAVWTIYRYLAMKKLLNNPGAGEHAYESIPFSDYITESVETRVSYEKLDVPKTHLW